ncbi:TrxA Thiol-disulfide isomerase and thioredoxins [Rhabdaerophilaceae bacterium]
MTVKPSRRFVVTGALAGLAFAASLVSGSAMAPGFIDYSKEKFDKALKGDKPVIVHVHADWCPVCVRQERAFNELSKSADYQKLLGIKVSFDMDMEFRKTYNVNNQSVIIIFKGGKEAGRIGGVTDTAKIAEFIAKTI